MKYVTGESAQVRGGRLTGSTTGCRGNGHFAKTICGLLYRVSVLSLASYVYGLAQLGRI